MRKSTKTRTFLTFSGDGLGPVCQECARSVRPRYPLHPGIS